MSDQDLSAFVGDGWHREEALKNGSYLLPAYGFIERVEIIPQAVYLSNMDSNGRYRLQAELRDAFGTIVPIRVEVVCRTVKTAEEMKK